jgi:hypothetical protein
MGRGPRYRRDARCLRRREPAGHLPDRLGDQGLHRTAAGRHGRARRGEPVRAGGELPARRRQAPGRRGDLGRPGDAHVGIAPAAARPGVVFAAEPAGSLRSLSGVAFRACRPPVVARCLRREQLRVLQLRVRPARLPARPGRGFAVRDAGNGTDLRPAGVARHDVRGSRDVSRPDGPGVRGQACRPGMAPRRAGRGRRPVLHRDRHGDVPASVPAAGRVTARRRDPGHAGASPGHPGRTDRPGLAPDPPRRPRSDLAQRHDRGVQLDDRLRPGAEAGHHGAGELRRRVALAARPRRLRRVPLTASQRPTLRQRRPAASGPALPGASAGPRRAAPPRRRPASW